MPCQIQERTEAGHLVPSNWVEAYCDLCGRRHVNRWVCLDRYERSATAVRLWLAGMDKDGDE